MNCHKDKIINLLLETNKWYCDDCISELLRIKPRQAVNAKCNTLNKVGKIGRKKTICFNCKKIKLSNSIKGNGRSLSNIKNQLIDNTITNTSQSTDDQNRIPFDKFENRVKIYLEKIYNKRFIEKALIVGENKAHKFDLVSKDNSIVVECKSYTWTKDDNFPSAKVSTAIEAVFYLSRIKADKKVIVFQDDYNKNGKSLVNTFVRRYGNLFDDTEIWTYQVNKTMDSDIVKVKRNSGSIWYEKLYCSK